MVDRADAYLPVVERIFAEEGLPDDFKYLVIQESSLQSDVVSSSNAVGYFQFKKETATEMGLRVDEEIDERMNIISASRSAARYIVRHNNYMQNWTYSLLAYYAGLGGAKNLIDPTKIGSKRLDIDENTHWYILKFVAHKIAFEPHMYRNPGAPNLRIAEFAECENKSLEQIANETKYPLDQLQFYNKWVRKGFIPGDKDYTLIIPLKADDSILWDSPTYVKASPPVENLGPWRDKILFGLIEKPVTQPEPVVLANGKTEVPVFFDWNGIKAIQAKKGDNPSVLALLAGISREDFLEYNDLRVFDPIVTGEVYYANHKKNRAKIPFHTVQYGESLWEVAQKYGLKMKSLMAKNRMPRPEKLKPGRVLWLRHIRPEDEPIKFEPVSEPIKPSVVSPDVVAKNTGPTTPPYTPQSQMATQNAEMKSVEAQAREVLGADTFTVELPEPTRSEELASENVEIEIVPEPQKPVAKVEPIVLASTQNNMQIISSQAVAPLPVILKPASVKPREAAISPAKKDQVEVIQGMTWYQISREYKVKVDSLIAWNPEQASGLQPGYKVWITRPVIETMAVIPASKPAVNQSIPSEYYEVKPGDTAFKIAQKFGLKVDEMLRLNGKDAAALSVGEKLRVK